MNAIHVNDEDLLKLRRQRGRDWWVLSAAAVILLSVFIGQAVIANRRAREIARHKQVNVDLLAAAERCDAEAVTSLLRDGADVDTRPEEDSSGAYFTPLMNAMGAEGAPVEKRRATAMLLLAHGANVNARSEHGWPVVVLCRDVAILEELLRRGADINATNGAGDTALILACSPGDPEMVKCLLRHGANTQVRNHVGETAMDWARNHPNIQALLKKSMK